MLKKSNYLVVVPARFSSKRLPGKPLKIISGIPMIIRTCLICLKIVERSNLIVASDDYRIINCCKKYGIKAMITPKKCKTGTDRVAEVAKKIKVKNYINVQGDEPLFNHLDLKKMIENVNINKNKVLLGYTRIRNKKDHHNKNVPKVVFDKNENLLYASRSPIPSEKNSRTTKSFRQVLVYSFPRKKLLKFGKAKKKSYLESLEDIEILRFLELNESVKLVKMSMKSHPVDTVKDLRFVRKIIKKKEKRK